ncbi:MAG: hypothetical protein ACLFTK_10830, partial [Anaerolineales bacterium]
KQTALTDESEWWVLQAIDLIEKLGEHDAELVRYFLTPPDEIHLPGWFVDEITKLWADILGEPQDAPPQPQPPSRFGRPSGRPSPFASSASPPTPPARGSTRFANASGSRSSLLHDGRTS